MGVTAELAAFAANTVSFPLEMRRSTRFSLFDWATVGLAGRNEPTVRLAREAILTEGGASQATVIGGGSASARAAASAGRLMRLDETRMAHALGLTATRAAGLKSQFGTMGKPLNAGFAAEVGVTCAILAAHGIVSNPDAIEGAQGFGLTHAGEARTSA